MKRDKHLSHFPARLEDGTDRDTPLKGCPIVPSQPARFLADAIHLAGKLDRSELLAEFTSYVSAHFDEQEFAAHERTTHG